MNLFTVKNGRKFFQGTDVTVNIVEPEINKIVTKNIVANAKEVSFSHREGYLWVVAINGKGGKIVAMDTNTSVDVYDGKEKVLTIRYADLNSFNPEEIYV